VAGRRLEKLREVIGEVQKQGGAGLAMECDVSRAKDVERAVTGTVERFGRLNILVNNAGALHVSTVEGISEEEWDRVIAVNVKGPFLTSRAVLPEFRKCGGGAIVNIGSVLGLVAMKDRAAYCASKGGVTMLTKAMAIDHGHENIRVNCICPSIVRRRMRESRSTELLGFDVESVHAGRAIFRLDVKPNHKQVHGVVHGGILAALADTTAAIAAYTAIPKGTEIATVELSINYLEPVPGGRIKADARVLRAGRNFIVTECEIFNENGSLAAKALLTFGATAGHSLYK